MYRVNDARKSYSEALTNQYDLIQSRGDVTHIDTETLDAIQATALPLHTTSASPPSQSGQQFFAPRVIENDSFFDSLWIYMPKDLPSRDTMPSAKIVCANIDHAYSMYKIPIEPDRKPSLMEMSGWGRAFNPGISCPREWNIESAYKLRRWERPHAMYSLVNETEGENNRLLRGELLSIMRVIGMFLDSKSYSKDNIFPVMVFSFGGTKGRILQAHFNKRGLSVYVGELYDFSTPSNAMRSTSVFLRYMCSEPKGRTVSGKQYLWEPGSDNGPRSLPN
ncbi:hypothetical protein BJX66DRAFT_339984 [Aspergillus keveii]|uniref:Uncharacterized protein n=1 Tax=Aspergillus keveii TaxID=714993 RepID=A0ABR4FZL3_9EURO